MTQGKIERRRSMKNVVKLQNYYSPEEKESRSRGGRHKPAPAEFADAGSGSIILLGGESVS